MTASTTRPHGLAVNRTVACMTWITWMAWMAWMTWVAWVAWMAWVACIIGMTSVASMTLRLAKVATVVSTRRAVRERVGLLRREWVLIVAVGVVAPKRHHLTTCR